MTRAPPDFRTSHAHLLAFENVINTNWNGSPPPISLYETSQSIFQYNTLIIKLTPLSILRRRALFLSPFFLVLINAKRIMQLLVSELI